MKWQPTWVICLLIPWARLDLILFDHSLARKMDNSNSDYLWLQLLASVENGLSEGLVQFLRPGRVIKKKNNFPFQDYKKYIQLKKKKKNLTCAQHTLPPPDISDVTLMSVHNSTLSRWGRTFNITADSWLCSVSASIRIFHICIAMHPITKTFPYLYVILEMFQYHFFLPVTNSDIWASGIGR